MLYLHRQWQSLQQQAQRAHMQAWFRAASGTRPSNSALKSTRVHQQGGCGWPVARCASMAQPFGPPHRGQRPGSMEGRWPSICPLPQAFALAFRRQACSSGSV